MNKRSCQELFSFLSQWEYFLFDITSWFIIVNERIIMQKIVSSEP